jgi:uncharacterized protein (TIGR03067 family)
MKRLVLSVVLLAAASAAGAPAPFSKTDREERRGDVAKLQGEWKETSYEIWISGGKYGVSHPGLDTWVITGRRLSKVRMSSSESIQQTIRLPAPATIDFISDRSGQAWRGVYELKGDALTICMAPPGCERPESLAGGRNGERVITFRRNR